MSLFASFTKKSKLDAAVKKAAKARENEESVADNLLSQVYQDFADIMTGDALRAETLYQWGVTLLRQAKGKPAAEAINIYRNAIAKFSFCMTIDPNFLAASIDAGVACMDLARARGVPPSDELYEMAKRQFEKANMIQADVASFNLACVHGLRGNHESCLEYLKLANAIGNLPDDADILADADLAAVANETWFKDFMADLVEERRLAQEKLKADKEAEEEAKREKAKKRNMDTFDPYKKADKPEEEAAKAGDETKADASPEPTDKPGETAAEAPVKSGE